MLRFSPANVKIESLGKIPAVASFLANKRKVYSFDLLSGHACPFANECFSKAVVKDGKRSIKDGPNTKFRCFSASQEVLFSGVYNLRSGNFEALKKMSLDQMVGGITAAMPANAGIIRIHVGGDFFNQNYFDAWLMVASTRPDMLFYAYTKSLPYWVNRMAMIPPNFVLTASRGGRMDKMIDENNLRQSVVVFSEQQAADMGLEIDHDDSHAANPATRDKSFALLIHGTQPKGSEASEAIKTLKVNGVKYAYSKAKK